MIKPPIIFEEIEKTVKLFQDRTALQVLSDEGDLRYTFGETLRLAKNVCAALGKRGVAKGEKVIFWSALNPHWVIAYLGALYRGAVVVPLDVEYGSDELSAICEETECRIIFTTQNKLPLLQSMLKNRRPSLSLVVLDAADEQDGVIRIEDLWQEGAPMVAPAQDILPEDEAIIFYTSGTTGKPKGVVIQHQTISNSVLGVLEYIDFKRGDSVLAIIPAHHVFASLANILMPLAKGACVTFLRALNSIELIKTLRAAQISVFPAVPQVFYLLHQKIFEEVGRKPLAVRALFRAMLRACLLIRRVTGINLGRKLFPSIHKTFGGSLRLLISAASYFDPHVMLDFYALGFTVQQGYGLTETFGGGTFTPYDKNVLGSVGLPIPGVQLKVCDPDEAGNGEIAISGLSLMRGYFKEPEATAEVLHDGWFYTGDLGRADSDGNYYITGRKKEMIVLSSGKKVYPEEVERHYLQSSYIKEMCVMGATAPTGYAQSERLHAIIVPDFDYMKQLMIVNAKEVIRNDVERLSAMLPKYKRILTYDIQTEELPRTSTKKLKRWLVQVQHAQRSKNAGAEASDEASSTRYKFVEGDDMLLQKEMSQRVLEVIRKESGVKGELHPDMNLELDLGFDSLQRTELIANTEQMLDISLGDEAVGQLLTIRDLLKVSESKLAAGERSNGNHGAAAERISWKQILGSAKVDEMVEKYVLKSYPVIRLVYFLLLKLVFLLSKILFNLKVRGVENLPTRGPYLICPNHQSYLDGVLITSVLPYTIFKQLFSVGHSPYFSGGFRDIIARIGRVVPIDPDTNLVRAMKVSAISLKAKKILLIFPEGGVSSDGELKDFKKGAAILAQELDVAVFPAAIKGSFDVWSKGTNRIGLAPVEIVFGPQIRADAPPLSPTHNNENYAGLAQKMEDEVKNLLVARASG